MTKPRAKAKKDPKKAPEIKKEEPKQRALTKEEKAKVKSLEAEIKKLDKEDDKLENQMCKLPDLEEEGPNYEAEENIKRDLKEIPKVCKRLGIDPNQYIEACKLYCEAWKNLDRAFSKVKEKVEEEEFNLTEKREDLQGKIDELRYELRRLKPLQLFRPHSRPSTFTF